MQMQTSGSYLRMRTAAAVTPVPAGGPSPGAGPAAVLAARRTLLVALFNPNAWGDEQMLPVRILVRLVLAPVPTWGQCPL